MGAQITTGLQAVFAAFPRGTEELHERLTGSWSDLSEVEIGYLFAATAAHNLKPYGPGTTPDFEAMRNFGLAIPSFAAP